MIPKSNNVSKDASFISQKEREKKSDSLEVIFVLFLKDCYLAQKKKKKNTLW